MHGMGLEEEMEYTQEQIDAMLAKAKVEATDGLFTKEDLEKQVQKEADRRVESGIQKGLDTYRAKWEKDALDKANLTAQEIADKQLQDKIKALETREYDANVRDNNITAKTMLSKAGIPESYYGKLIGNLVNADAEITGSNVNNLIEIYTATKTQIEADIKSQLSNVRPAGGGNDPHSGEMTKEKFNKLSYSAISKLKNEQPTVYEQMMRK